MKMEPSFNIGSISCDSIYGTFTMTLLGYRLTCFHIFVLHVMAPGGLEPEGQGIKAIQKVRLMHSAIRHLVKKTGRWMKKKMAPPSVRRISLVLY